MLSHLEEKIIDDYRSDKFNLPWWIKDLLALKKAIENSEYTFAISYFIEISREKTFAKMSEIRKNSESFYP